jgi:hypothetical protein
MVAPVEAAAKPAGRNTLTSAATAQLCSRTTRPQAGAGGGQGQRPAHTLKPLSHHQQRSWLLWRAARARECQPVAAAASGRGKREPGSG